MAKLIPIVAILMVIAASEVRGRSLPGNIDGAPNELIRIRRSDGGDNQSRKPGHLQPSGVHLDQETLTNKISESVAHGTLCNVAEAKPGTKIPCSEGNYFVEWSPVENGAANISVYSVLHRVNRL